jgi:general secretion pathway protein H
VVRQLRIAQQQAIRNDRPVQVEISVADNAFRLADEVIQLPVDIALTVRTAEDQLIDSGTVGMSFYPDASASGGRILLESETETFEIEIVWITGMIATQHKLRDA